MLNGNYSHHFNYDLKSPKMKISKKIQMNKSKMETWTPKNSGPYF